MSKLKFAAMFTLRKDGRYMGFWHDVDGIRHAIYDKDPERLYNRIVAKETPPEPTFAVIAETWHDKHWDEIEDGTKSSYAAPYRRAVEEFGKRIASEIQPYEIAAVLMRLKDQKYSAKTIRMQKTVFKQIYENAIIDKGFSRYIKTNPVLLAPLPKNMPKPIPREAPEDEAVQKIRDNAGTAYFGLFALFLMSTGFRRGEALGIQWKDVDFQKGWISCSKSVSHRGGVARLVDHTKTAAGVRKVPILPDLKQLLKRPKEADDEDFLFYGEDPRRPMPPATYNRRWRHYCIEMGFVDDDPEERISVQGKHYVVHHYKPSLTAHNFRHGYATLLFEAEVDELTAQRLIGHASIETTHAIYTHLRQKKQQSSVEKLIGYVAEDMKK